MKTEVTIVPKDKCPLDVLADFGDRTSSAWIFLHNNAVKKLVNSADNSIHSDHLIHLSFDATEDYPKTKIIIETNSMAYYWNQVKQIIAEDIAFKCSAIEPSEIFLLKMEN